MNTIATAEELFAVMRGMPADERIRFFTLIGQNVVERKDYAHHEVFGDVRNAEFTATEAAEYLEVSVGTLRRYVQARKINPGRTVGRSQFFNDIAQR